MKRKDIAMKHKQFAFKADAVHDDGSFTGYGSVFDNVDSYREIVAPGAFADSLKSIKSSGDPLPALWQHRSGEPIGGFDQLEEDAHGLKVAGWLLKDEIPRAAEAYALMKRRVVKGLSIGYYVLEDSWNEKDRIRTLTKLELVEISIVTFPANDQAQIDSVKSMEQIIKAGKLPTLSEFEDFLRESGFSKSQATAIAGRGLKDLLSRGEPGGEKGDVLSALRNFNLNSK
ncbi:MAG TPA: HK97 family phage prohead protease [Noviherbaspirillum sp.]|jgi:HK97 family phage prohead protease|uniref:HK97 family phage prohead protease n=1 Tax=Noviherbaspirillum sp. TaxID=1926288 RepID=UPI002F9398E5